MDWHVGLGIIGGLLAVAAILPYIKDILRGTTRPNIVSWQVAQQPVLAIFFAVLADLMASIPTVVKTYRDPWSETPTAYPGGLSA